MSQDNFGMKYDMDSDSVVKDFLANNPTIRLNIIKEIIETRYFRVELLTDFTFREKVELFIKMQQHIPLINNEALKNCLSKIEMRYKNSINNLDNSLTDIEVDFLMLLFKQSIHPAYNVFCQLMNSAGFKIQVICLDDDDNEDNIIHLENDNEDNNENE